MDNNLVLLLIALFIVYWLVWFAVTRPWSGQYGVVGRRPPVGSENQKGRISLIGIGTYGAKQVSRLGSAFIRANCEGQVGGVMLLELNDEKRQEVFNGFPLKQRVEWGGSPLIKNGLANLPIVKVDEPEMRQRWAFDLKAAVLGFTAKVRRPRPFTPAFDPSLVIEAVSTGGHLLLALEAAKLLKNEFKRADFYAVTIIPEERAQRQELWKAISMTKSGQEYDGIFRWWLITDNRLNKDRNDKAVALFFASITQAHRVSPYADDNYNIQRVMYPQGDGFGAAVLHYWERDVAVYRTPLPPFDYYMMRDDAVNGILDGIAELRRNQLRCVPFDTYLPDLRRFIVVNIALRRPYHTNLEDEIRARLEDDTWFKANNDLTLVFSSLGEHLNPASKWITLSVMLVEMAKKPLTELPILEADA